MTSRPSSHAARCKKRHQVVTLSQSLTHVHAAMRLLVWTCSKLRISTANDDWDVYYERGRKPKESIIKHEAARSEGDYRRKVLLPL